jgi:acetyl-CoA carboxylase alpha subunit
MGKAANRRRGGGVSVPVEEKIFSSEVKRLDSDIANVKKSQEKFGTKTEKAIDDLRQDVRELRQEMRDLRQDVRVQIDRLDNRLWWLMGAVMVSILTPIALRFLFP